MSDRVLDKSMLRRIKSAVLVAAVGFAALASDRQRASADGDIPYPAGYRKWVRVRTVLVGPQSPAFKSSGGIHHIYANGKALEGYAKGTFPDGSILVFDLLEAKESNGITTEGKRERIDVMMRDSGRFSSTGGWGFERFPGNDDKPGLTTEQKTACFDCHQQRKDHDLVFSEYRE